MAAYYNEHDGFKAEWLRELIRCGHIAAGEVNERDIRTVEADDLRGFTQCHFFAGGGVWSYALRLAGWPDDRPVWTGSCPCPGFSAAGKGGGFRDARHLWPDWFRLIRECRPANIFGEQADDAIGFGWLDLVQTDLEAADYAVGKAVFGACSVGAPHIRQRLYFGANAQRWTAERHGHELAEAARGVQGEACQRERLRADAGDGDATDSRADAEQSREWRRGLLGPREGAAIGSGIADERGKLERTRLEGHAGHGDDGVGMSEDRYELVTEQMERSAELLGLDPKEPSTRSTVLWAWASSISQTADALLKSDWGI